MRLAGWTADGLRLTIRAMDPVVLTIFVLVYAAMVLGGIPGLALDRTGAALLGAIALLAAGHVSPTDAWDAVDVPTLALLFGLTVVLPNLVSNVPAVMLLLPSATHPLDGPLLALASTLAGNLLLVGSIANLIVADQAGRLGVAFGWREHARYGVPVTLGTLAVAGAWLAVV